jgi:hypothetical protein
MKVSDPRNPVTNKWLSLEGYRLDAPPYLSGAVEAKVRIEKLKVKKQPLKQVTQGRNGGIYNGPQFSRNYVTSEEYGVPFLSGSSILLTDITRLPLLSKKDANSAKLSYLRIEEGMTLISCSGSIGRMAYARSEMSGMWSSQDVMKVVPNPAIIPPGYLFAYLSSEYGKTLITSGTYGAIIQHIEPEHIASLPVPRFEDKFELHVHQLIQQAGNEFSEHTRKLEEATTTVVRKANILNPSRSKWWSGNEYLGWGQATLNEEAFRAYNFDPRARRVETSIKKGNWSNLEDIVHRSSFKATIIFKRITSSEEHGFKLIGQRDAFQIFPDGRWIARSSVKGLGLVVKPLTVLVPSHGTLGENEVYCRALIATHQTSKYAFSGDLYRLVAKEKCIHPGYLFAFMRSEAAFRLMRSISTGSKQQLQVPSMMRRLPIPRLDKVVEHEIAQLVLDAVELFDSAFEKQKQAVSLIEQRIKAGA